MNCTECAELKRERTRDNEFIHELCERLHAFASRIRCEALTQKGTACSWRPWWLRAGRPVCTSHHRAKSVRFAP